MDLSICENKLTFEVVGGGGGGEITKSIVKWIPVHNYDNNKELLVYIGVSAITEETLCTLLILVCFNT